MSDKDEEYVVEGRNPVLECFRSGKAVDKLYVQEGLKDGVIMTILREAKKQDTIIKYIKKESHAFRFW